MTKKKSTHIASSAVITGAMFGVGMGAFNATRYGMTSGIASGLGMGVAFGLAVAGFLHWQHKKAGLAREQFGAEGLELDAPCNMGPAGGWLFLTKQRLVWIPHALNVGAKRVEIARADITSTKAKGRKLEILTTAAPQTFLLRATDEWAAAITSLPSARVVDR